MINFFKKIILVGVVAIFIFVCLNNSKKIVSAEDLLVASGVSGGLVGNDLIVLLLQLKAISLDTDIFTNKTFTSLKDFGTEIKPQPVGRKNPFLLIGFDSSGDEAEDSLEEDLFLDDSDLDIDLDLEI